MLYAKNQLTAGNVPILEPIAPSAPPVTVTAVHEPASATKATITVAAAAGVRHLCSGISASVAAGATAQTPVHVRLIDGGTGGAAIIWTLCLSAPVNTCDWIEETGLAILGSINTAMTLEFEAAGVAGSFETVTLHYFDTVEV
jgi:hypothetical protein